MLALGHSDDTSLQFAIYMHNTFIDLKVQYILGRHSRSCVTVYFLPCNRVRQTVSDLGSENFPVYKGIFSHFDFCKPLLLPLITVRFGYGYFPVIFYVYSSWGYLLNIYIICTFTKLQLFRLYFLNWSLEIKKVTE